MTTKTTKTKLAPLFKHQQVTRKKGAKCPRLLDFSDPGTGKTRAHSQIWYDRYQKDGKALLVLCPKTLCETAWEADIQRFFPGVATSVAYAENREQAFKRKADVYITNIDAVKWLANQPKKFFDKFDSLVIDELTAYKSGGRQGEQRSKAAADIAPYFEYRAGLTGTPVPNSVTELWHQALLIDDGKRLGKKFYPFRAAICTPMPVPGVPKATKWVDKDGAAEAVFGLLNDITIRHKLEECIDIPDIHQYHVGFFMNRKHKKMYDEFAKDAYLQLDSGHVEGVHAASLRAKLLQIASGAVYGNPLDPRSDYLVLDTARYELILDLVEQRPASVVFFNWQHQKEELLKEAARRKVPAALLDGSTPLKDRKRLVDEFQQGDYQVMFLHWQTGSHGITLTRAATFIACSPIDSVRADYFKQAIHRIRRAGQTQKQEAILVEAQGTCESEVYQKLSDKSFRMSKFLELCEL